jgi:hypothetical protein
MSVVLFIQDAMGTPPPPVLYCILCKVWLYHIFPRYLLNGTIFREKILKIKYVFYPAVRF